MENQSSDFVGHEPCPSCSSRDNFARYSDGHGHCFGCGHYEHSGDSNNRSMERVKMQQVDLNLVVGESRALPSRNITQKTCEFWKYEVGEMNGQPCHIANHYKDGQKFAQKIRLANKDFKFLGDTKKIPLYGQWLFRDKGKMLVVVEGELDALSVSQLQDHKWPVVSVPNGAQGAAKSIANNIDYVEGFDSVIFMFDMDEVGQEAAKECASLLKPSRGKIASLPLKDANEMLVAGRGKEVIDAIWGAKVYRPDGIISGIDTWDRLKEWGGGVGWEMPWAGLNDMLRGLREREITTFCSGSGLGKSTICRELAAAMVADGVPIGYIALEESIEKTALYFMSIYLNRPLYLQQDINFDDPEIREAWEKTVGVGGLELYDHFGSMGSDTLLTKIKYLKVAMGVKYVFLDHVSIVVSGQETDNERRTIDMLMTNLRSLVEETGVGIVLVSHVKRPDGKGHEEGARVTLAQLRGSAAIAQLSDNVIGLERNQQGHSSDELRIRVLKNRLAGQTGIACTLTYDHETGRLYDPVGKF